VALDRLDDPGALSAGRDRELESLLREERAQYSTEVHERYKLLSELYSQRLRMFETLKMEDVTERVLGQDG